MQVTFASEDKVEMLELDESFSVGIVEEIVFPALGVAPPHDRVQWVLNGKILQTGNKEATLKSLGIANGDMVTFIAPVRRPNPGEAQQQGLRRNVRARQNGPVYFEGMSVDEVIQYNPNPLFAVQVLRQRPELVRELQFHIPTLAQNIGSARTDEEAADFLREHLLEHSISRSMQVIEEQQKDEAMRQRLSTNPEDPEAKQYIEEKENLERIEEQRMTMMHEYPETMFPVLMLYITTKINGVDVQAFVDCGAQTSVMSLACAKRCGLDKLIDKRYKGKIVGVGTSIALGKIYIVPIQIGNTFFPMSVTIMDSLGDKNMEFLFGLDMLKRHKFCIDLEKGFLTFHGANGELCSTPFLHEKDLPAEKGGTKGFDPSKALPFDEDEEEGALPEATEAETRAREAKPETNPDIKRSDDVVMETPSQLEEANAASQTDEFEAKIQRLTSLGYSRESVVRVLTELDGDEDTALTVLMFEDQ